MTIEFGRGASENPDDPFHGDDVGTSLVVVTGLGGEGGSRGDDPGPAAGGLPHDDSSTAAHVHEALVPQVPVRPQHRVHVDVERCGQLSGGRELPERARRAAPAGRDGIVTVTSRRISEARHAPPPR